MEKCKRRKQTSLIYRDPKICEKQQKLQQSSWKSAKGEEKNPLATIFRDPKICENMEKLQHISCEKQQKLQQNSWKSAKGENKPHDYFHRV